MILDYKDIKICLLRLLTLSQLVFSTLHFAILRSCLTSSQSYFRNVIFHDRYIDIFFMRWLLDWLIVGRLVSIHNCSYTFRMRTSSTISKNYTETWQVLDNRVNDYVPTNGNDIESLIGTKVGLFFRNHEMMVVLS